MHNPKAIWAVLTVLGAPLMLSGCLYLAQSFAGNMTYNLATGQHAPQVAPPDQEPVSKPLYTSVYDQVDHMKELMDAGDFDKADRLYGEQQAFFDTHNPASDRAVERLARHHQEALRSEISNLRTALKDANSPLEWEKWASLKAAFDEARALQELYEHLAIFRDGKSRVEDMQTLHDEVQSVKDNLMKNANAAYNAYPQTSEVSFFDAYPVFINSITFGEKRG